MSASQPSPAPVGIFGGTYNPVHFGHLRSALELVEKLGLEQLRLMPCAVPPLRQEPACGAAHRAAMVELAVAGEPRLTCDTRELDRAGKSFTIDSLIELRSELGDSRSLCMVMGCDAVLDVTHWHRWRELLDWAHIVIIARPGWTLPETGEVAKWLDTFRIEQPADLCGTPCGAVLVEELRPLPISSTDVRELLASGRSARYLVPESVLDYIHTNELYC